MPPWPSVESAAILVIAVPLIYFAMVFLGRRLKRRDGVRVGWMHQLFAITLTLYTPIAFTEFPYSWELCSAVAMQGGRVFERAHQMLPVRASNFLLP